jgi:hypothetical protein
MDNPEKVASRRKTKQKQNIILIRRGVRRSIHAPYILTEERTYRGKTI